MRLKLRDWILVALIAAGLVVFFLLSGRTPRSAPTPSTSPATVAQPDRSPASVPAPASRPRTPPASLHDLQVEFFDQMFAREMDALVSGYRANTKNTDAVALRQHACFRRIAALRARGKALRIDSLARSADNLESACRRDAIQDRIRTAGEACVIAETRADNCDASRLRETVVTGGTGRSCSTEWAAMGAACR